MRFARSVPRDFWRRAAGGNALQACQERPQAARRVEVMHCPCRALLRLVLRLAHHGRQAKKNRLGGGSVAAVNLIVFKTGGIFRACDAMGLTRSGGLLTSDAPSP